MRTVTYLRRLAARRVRADYLWELHSHLMAERAMAAYCRGQLSRRLVRRLCRRADRELDHLDDNRRN